jgi:hypothetical protein
MRFPTVASNTSHPFQQIFKQEPSDGTEVNEFDWRWTKLRADSYNHLTIRNYVNPFTIMGIINRPMFYLKHCVSDTALSPSSGGMYLAGPNR